MSRRYEETRRYRRWKIRFVLVASAVRRPSSAGHRAEDGSSLLLDGSAVELGGSNGGRSGSRSDGGCRVSLRSGLLQRNISKRSGGGGRCGSGGLLGSSSGRDGNASANLLGGCLERRLGRSDRSGSILDCRSAERGLNCRRCRAPYFVAISSALRCDRSGCGRLASPRRSKFHENNFVST